MAQEAQQLVNLITEIIPEHGECRLIRMDDTDVITVVYAKGCDYLSTIYQLKGETAHVVMKITRKSGEEITSPVFKYCDDPECVRENILYFVQVALELKNNNTAFFIFVSNINGNYSFYQLSSKDAVYWGEYD